MRRASLATPCANAQRLAIPAQVILTGPFGGVTQNSAAHFDSYGFSRSSSTRWFAGAPASAIAFANRSRIAGSKSSKKLRTAICPRNSLLAGVIAAGSDNSGSGNYRDEVGHLGQSSSSERLARLRSYSSPCFSAFGCPWESRKRLDASGRPACPPEKVFRISINLFSLFGASLKTSRYSCTPAIRQRPSGRPPRPRG